MKKIGKLALFLFITMGVAQAGEVEIFTGAESFNYHENAASNETGELPFVGVSGTTKLNDQLNLSGFFKFAAGSLMYNGETWGGVPLNEHYLHRFYQGAVTLEYQLAHFNQNTLYVYSGMGHYEWERDYENAGELYAWNYFPIGLKFNTQLSKKSKMTLQMEYQYLSNPSVTAYLSKLNPEVYSDITVQLPYCYGLYLATPVTYSLNEQWGVEVTPYYKYFRLQKSPDYYYAPVLGTVSEPSSVTNEYGIECGLTYHF